MACRAAALLVRMKTPLLWRLCGFVVALRHCTSCLSLRLQCIVLRFSEVLVLLWGPAVSRHQAPLLFLRRAALAHQHQQASVEVK
ncbi:hypothetical protein IWX48DRAFT_164330 [Phyllosticta citricarpa]